MKTFLDDYAVDLLHINDAKHNKLLDLTAADPSKTYYLSREGNRNFSEYMLLNIGRTIGRIAQTVLANSAVSKMETLIGKDLSHLEWENGEGKRDTAALDRFIRETYKDISFKGINPLFLSIGAIKWRLQVTQKEFRDVISPLLIFPVRLIRSASTTPVSIEFVDDDVYFNPCLYKKMEQVLLGDTAKGFPHPNGMGADVDDPIDLERLGDGNEYFAAVEQYVRSCAGEDGSAPFELLKDTVAIAQYNHSDLCMYYDFRRNRQRIENHPLVQAVFDPNYRGEEPVKKTAPTMPYFVLQHDSVQKDMIMRVVNGESMVIKGPPGTGKTVTIANMISALLAERKQVLFVSSKISALAEVYHKLPDNLRKFALLLDYESEKQAADINPTVIKRDLGDLVEAARTCSISDSVYEARNLARSDRFAAMSEIEQYHKLMFGASLPIGDNYYRVLDIFCRHPELKMIRFAKAEELLTLSGERYHTMLTHVREAESAFDTLTEDGKLSIRRNPWFGITEGVDTERVYRYYGQLDSRIGEIFEAVSAAVPAGLPHLCLLDLVWAWEGNAAALNSEVMASLSLTDADIETLSDALVKYLSACKAQPCDPSRFRDEWIEKYKAITDLAPDGDISVTDLRRLYQYRDLFYDVRGVALNRGAVNELSKLTERMEADRAACAAHLDRVFEVFRKTEAEEDLKKIRNGAVAFKKYTERPADAPGAFDLKAKLALKELIPLCYLADTPFSDIVNATAEMQKATELTEAIYETAREINRVYKKELTEKEAREVRELIPYMSQYADKLPLFVDRICGAYGIVNDFAAELSCEAGTKLSELKRAYDAICRSRDLREAVERVELRAGRGFALPNAEQKAKAICAWRGLSAMPDMKYRTAQDLHEIIGALCRLPREAVETVRDLLVAFDLFGEECFENEYTVNTDRITMEDLQFFRERWGDRGLLNAALNYSRALNHSENALDLSRFFRPFEYGEATRESGCSFADIFEHSVYGMITEGYSKLLQERRHAMGRSISANFEKLAKADARMEELNRQIIEKKLLAAIRPDDEDFRFLSHERAGGSGVRRLFRQNSASILKLKKCMIMSPSTASVLLQHPDYTGFDIVIIDEASQTESVTLLPVLSRSRQCVIVGDEWQMPPIKHFESKTDSVQYSEEDAPEDSALSLVLKNAPFSVTQLVCHYRSRTESLIKFSQKSFYPNMRTFPSPVPKKERLGFTDVYLEDGECVNGVNEVEARRVVECVREHFERFYDKESEQLTRSFGVVTFGVAQLNRIKAIIKADAEFKKKWMHTAERTDVDDLFFYCTVETVQGQQTEDMFLSLTYTGHSSLNANELGKQVFNVAVSRATDSVTVVHSRRAMDTKPDYVREYLEIVEYFAADGQSPFLAQEPELGFLNDVRNCIIRDFKLPSDRVICNYGATEGSVRIPIAILDPERKSAELGIFCEVPTEKRYDYLDYNLGYYNILTTLRQWKLHRVYIHDWVDNGKAEKQALGEAIKRYVTF